MSTKLIQCWSGISANDIRSAGRNGAKTGLSLLKRRRWFAEGGAEGETGSDQSGTDDARENVSDETNKTQNDNAPQNVSDLPQWAQKIINDARRDAGDYRKKLREFEDAQTEKERKDAEEQGKYKELYEKQLTQLEELKELREAKQTRLEALVAANNKRLEGLSKDDRATVENLLATAGVDEDADKVAAMLDTLLPKFASHNPPPPKVGSTKGDDRNVSSSGKIELPKAGF